MIDVVVGFAVGPFDENIQLLADKERFPFGLQVIDHLQHTRVDAFGVEPGQRLLRHDIGFDANKL